MQVRLDHTSMLTAVVVFGGAQLICSGVLGEQVGAFMWRWSGDPHVLLRKNTFDYYEFREKLIILDV